ncbi:hypothetical protein RB653_005049 [Dictyostelium firmibasis]|uniref:Uncharacterized protein n=1 Tax=Dictyostelium firmibasis TaxID=79012 RepID=A0AAN7U0L5_9MYCE
MGYRWSSIYEEIEYILKFSEGVEEYQVTLASYINTKSPKDLQFTNKNTLYYGEKLFVYTGGVCNSNGVFCVYR